MRALRHAADQPFVLCVALAALIHSTWTVAIMFGGVEPQIVDLGGAARWLGWVLPAFLFAFALDVGQVSTASDIRRGDVRPAKLATFVVLAGATYLLQLLYLLHHVPAVAFGAGLSEGSQAAARVVWEVAIWLVPGLLPCATLLYTSADRRAAAALEVSEVGDPGRSVALVQEQADGGFRSSCPACGWSIEKPTRVSAQNALNGHRGQCPALPLVLVPANGSAKADLP